MATTRLMPLHNRKDRTTKNSISNIIDYVENPGKTDNGRLITCWQCEGRVADAEFLYTKEEYLRKTGRSQGDNDVIGYHLRQSFRPGEITPEEANRLGCELAKRFTKGRHAFIVCTHIDKAHIHNHIIWNSTSLDADRKFRNFWGSSRAIRRLNDTICVQNGYSIVADPKKHSGKSYNKWLGDKKKLSHRERICLAIDDALAQNPKSFEALLELLKQAGYQVKDGKVPSLLGGDQKRFLRMDTLGEAYSPEALRAIIKGSRKHIPKVKLAEVVEETPVENLIDFVQAKLTRKNSAGRSKVQSVSDLKRLASSLLFLQENGLLDRTTLEKKVAEVSLQFSKLNSQIKQIEGQLDENAKMQQHIIDYKKTRDVYMAYHKAGYSKKFLSEHESDIIKHKAAKKFFDDRGMTKWPKIKKLRADFHELVAKKRTLNAERKKVEKEVRELQMAQYFVDRAYGDAEKTEKERKTVLR